MKAPFMRNPFNYDLDKASDESALHCKDPSLTVQSMAEDADINVMMARFGITGKMPENLRLPEYGDFDGINNFQDALQAVQDATNEFNKLPGGVRAKFANSPQAFLEFCSDEANRAEMQQMGLLKPIAAEAEPMKVRIVPEEGSAKGDKA